MSEIKLTKTHIPENGRYDYAYCINVPNKKGMKSYTIFGYDSPKMHPGNLQMDTKHPELSYFMRDEIGIYARLFNRDILTVADENGDLILSFNRLEAKPKIVIYQEPKTPFIHILSAKDAKQAGFIYENKSPTAQKRNNIKKGISFLLAASALFGSCKYADTHLQEIKETSAPLIEKITGAFCSFKEVLDNQIHR